MLIIAQSAATSRSFAMKHGQRADINRDIVGLAGANLAAGLSGAFVVNGSPTKTQILDEQRGKTQLANMTMSRSCCCSCMFATGLLKNMPSSVLAAIVFIIGIDLIDVEEPAADRGSTAQRVRHRRGHRSDVFAIGVEQGIILAIVLSILEIIRRQYSPKDFVVGVTREGSRPIRRRPPAHRAQPGLIVFRYDADLFYANVNRFVDDVEALVEQRSRPGPMAGPGRRCAQRRRLLRGNQPQRPAGLSRRAKRHLRPRPGRRRPPAHAADVRAPRADPGHARVRQPARRRTGLREGIAPDAVTPGELRFWYVPGRSRGGRVTRPVDTRGRGVADLRLSVTDRCNLRCTYCMPRELFGANHQFLPRSEILSYEEFARLVGIFAGLGVSKVRLTGGEPLLRPEIETLISAIAGTSGIEDIAMTTNGALLAGRAGSLREAGLSRVTVSLDSVDPATFATMADTKVPLSTVLDGITAAVEAGFGPIKLNAVVQRGVNDDGIVELAKYARDGGHVLRFIEYMDVGSSNGWTSSDVVPAAEIIARVNAVFPIRTLPPSRAGEVARRWGYEDGRGEIGVITSVSEPFCGDCTRARITSTGELFTCLFASQGTDLRVLLRSGATDDELRAAITSVWAARDDNYSEQRQNLLPLEVRRAEMSYLGG